MTLINLWWNNYHLLSFFSSVNEVLNELTWGRAYLTFIIDFIRFLNIYDTNIRIHKLPNDLCLIDDYFIEYIHWKFKIYTFHLYKMIVINLIQLQYNTWMTHIAQSNWTWSILTYYRNVTKSLRLQNGICQDTPHARYWLVRTGKMTYRLQFWGTFRASLLKNHPRQILSKLCSVRR